MNYRTKVQKKREYTKGLVRICIKIIHQHHKGEVISYDIKYVDWSPSNTTTQMELEKRNDTFDMSEFN